MSDFLQALRVQRRVIYAFIIRETRTRFGKSKLGYFWALFEPVTYILSFLGIFSLLNRTAPIPVDIKLFFFTGIMPWLLFSRCVGMTSGAIEANYPLLYFPQVKVLDIVLARFILEFSTLIFVGLLYLGIFIYFEIAHISIDSYLLLLAGLLLAAFLGVSFGLVGAIIKLYLPAYNDIQNIFTRILFFASGVFFVADTLPSAVKPWVWYSPLVHITELVRSAFFKDFQSSFYDIRYPIFVGVVLLFIGLSLERVSRYKIGQLGS